MSDLIYSSATSIAQSIREKRLSSREVVEAHLRRIEAVNTKLNAYAQLCGEAALDRALVATWASR